MVEMGVIGGKRLEYLDIANKAWAEGNVPAAKAFFENFLTTIKENSKVADELKVALDKIEQKKMNTINEIAKNTESLDVVTQAEVRKEQVDILDYKMLHEKIDAAWKICLTERSFNE